MHRQDLLDGLDFDDDAVLDDEVDSVGGRELHASVYDGQPHLTSKLQTVVA